MQKIFKLFKTSKAIESFEIVDFNSGSDFYFYKAKIKFIDSSVLFIREYISSTEHAYSYHWQDQKNNIIIRWDNAPHHKNLKTYPHHKHTPNVEESYETNVKDIIKFIEKILLE